MKIVVGISGGVDSAVTALLLKNAGHEVYGATMKLWNNSNTPQQHRVSKTHACFGPDEQEDIIDAQKICDFLSIPLHIVDCAEQYRSVVLQYFESEYCAGRTPNPCVICNQNIKLGLLPQIIKDSLHIHFDYFATGHYARIHYNTLTHSYHLLKAHDHKKDQSYFLYRLSPKQLSTLLFPLGELTKKQVRSIALENRIPVSQKEESQDFYSGDYTELITNKPKPGNIVTLAGKIIGTHKGIHLYTIGQRKGLGIATGAPCYVIGINAQKNEIIVGDKELLSVKGLRATQLNCFSRTIPQNVSVKIRSTSPEVDAVASIENDSLFVSFKHPQIAVTPGQSVVVYDQEKVICGGIIVESI